MTVTLQFPNRGAANPDTRATNGREANFQRLADEVNSLVVSGITADSFFSADVRNVAADTVLGTIATTEVITPTNDNVNVDFPAADSAPTVFDGGIYHFFNAATANKFNIRDNDSGTLIAGMNPGDHAFVFCTSDTTSGGAYETHRFLRPDHSDFIVAFQMFI